jgi:TorA maturation chaperone TorD
MAAIFHWLAGTLAGDDPALGWSELEVTGPSQVVKSLTRITNLLFTADAEPAEEERWQREAERVRLFEAATGGVPAPPYGSWWLEGCLGGETSRAVANFYREEGLQPGNGPADYLSTELELVQFLLRHQRAGRLTGQEETASSARQREHEFISLFLLPWVPDFCTAGRRATTDHFWIAIFDLLETLLHAEQARLGATKT